MICQNLHIMAWRLMLGCFLMLAGQKVMAQEAADLPAVGTVLSRQIIIRDDGSRHHALTQRHDKWHRRTVSRHYRPGSRRIIHGSTHYHSDATGHYRQPVVTHDAGLYSMLVLAGAVVLRDHWLASRQDRMRRHWKNRQGKRWGHHHRRHHLYHHGFRGYFWTE